MDGVFEKHNEVNVSETGPERIWILMVIYGKVPSLCVCTVEGTEKRRKKKRKRVQ